jgi:hypothetical protein
MRLENKLEDQVTNQILIDEPWKLIEKFSTLVRESGSPDELEAGRYIIGRLKHYGIRHQVLEPELYLSIPKSVTVEVLEPEARELRHDKRVMNPKVMSMSPSVDIEAELAYVPSRRASSVKDFFDTGIDALPKDLVGKIVLTEGLSIMPSKSKALESAGSIAIVSYAPQDRTHEGISTTIWGIPTVENLPEKPRIPSVVICNSDGVYLKGLLERGAVKVHLRTVLDEGWKRCIIPVAEVRSPKSVREFVLLHGHYDSWHYGIGDNAVGDAGLLELARVFNNFRKRLKRNLRIAWWPGHSTGRYAGSTWYADNFALDLYENCVAQVDMDSPGCRDATAYEDVCWMDEAEGLCKKTIKDVTGLKSNGIRPLRAGDYSFNSIGITSFFMLLSTIPEEDKKKRGLYAVGGCGGNIEWHTEEDNLPVADKEVLLKDMKIYALAVLRVLNSSVLPFDFRETIRNSLPVITHYENAANGKFDLKPVKREMTALLRDLEAFYSRVQRVRSLRESERANKAILRLGRALIPLNYAYERGLDHDPAVQIPPYPDLAIATALGDSRSQVDERFVTNQLTRGRNTVIRGLRTARLMVQQAFN